MKIKTSELTGAALDWAVAKCEGRKEPEVVNNFAVAWYTWQSTHYSTDWSQGGLIIEREHITLRPVYHAERTESGTDTYRQDGWAAHVEPKAFWVTPRPYTGPTPLIAAMRCFCCAKLGDEIEIPEELQPCQPPNLY